MTEHRRNAAVKGSFYPSSCSKLKIYFQKFSDRLSPQAKADAAFSVKPRAIIVPHAGYVFSGFTANMAYRALANSHPKRAIVIGPSHHYYFEGISGAYYETFETPCGDIRIDTDYLVKLAKQFDIGFEAQAHKEEHSTEVQMPFIHHYLPNAEVIELVYGRVSADRLAKLIGYLLDDRENVVVISSDLSHFYSKAEAKTLDTHCLKAIAKLDVSELDKGCEACGLIGIRAILIAAKKSALRSRLMDYRTSADYSGDSSRVVGYTSAIFYR